MINIEEFLHMGWIWLGMACTGEVKGTRFEPTDTAHHARLKEKINKARLVLFDATSFFTPCFGCFDSPKKKREERKLRLLGVIPARAPHPLCPNVGPTSIIAILMWDPHSPCFGFLWAPFFFVFFFQLWEISWPA